MRKNTKKLLVGAGILSGLAGLVLALQKKDKDELPTPPPPPPPGSGNLYGYITDSETGSPVVGATLLFYQDISETETKDYRRITDTFGFYSIEGMTAGIEALYVIEAGGYIQKTGSLMIGEENIQLDITLPWAGGSRDVPRFISASIPGQVQLGEEFPASVTVWLPYQSSLFRVRVRLSSGRTRVDYDWWAFPDHMYDRLASKYFEKLPILRLEADGQRRLDVDWLYGWSHWGDLQPGIYDVICKLERQWVAIASNGLLEFGASDYEVSTGIGTLEVV